MPEQEDRQEKTEKATPRKREEARKKGQVAKSKEVATAALLMAGLGVFYFFGQGMIQTVGEVMEGLILESSSMDINRDNLPILLKRIMVDASYIMVPLLFFPLVGIIANVMQVGVMFTAEPLTPNLSRLNPIDGLKKLFSPTALAEFIKVVLKLMIIGYMGYVVIKGETGRFGSLTNMDTTGILFYLGSTAFSVLLNTSWILIIVAVLDYLFQRWDMDKNLRMTKQEVKEELKDTEGQPLIKTRIKTLQRQIARQRMMQDNSCDHKP